MRTALIVTWIFLTSVTTGALVSFYALRSYKALRKWNRRRKLLEWSKVPQSAQIATVAMFLTFDFPLLIHGWEWHFWESFGLDFTTEPTPISAEHAREHIEREVEAMLHAQLGMPRMKA